MKLDFFGDIFERCSSLKFHENLSIWIRVLLCGQTWRNS